MNVYKTKSEIAEELLRGLFAKRHRVTISEAVTLAHESGISRRTLTRVARELGIKPVQTGPSPGLWEWQED
jgi:DNA-binding MurR/RpiR family transcriptional regulator